MFPGTLVDLQGGVCHTSFKGVPPFKVYSHLGVILLISFSDWFKGTPKSNHPALGVPNFDPWPEVLFQPISPGQVPGDALSAAARAPARIKLANGAGRPLRVARGKKSPAHPCNLANSWAALALSQGDVSCRGSATPKKSPS